MKSPSRRKAREAALRALYEIEVGFCPTAEAIANTLEENPVADNLKDFTELLTYGVRANLGQIDSAIQAALANYSLDRLVALDRNLLRLAAYELLFVPGLPPAVTINEAVSIAKKYSTAESGKFVNGVLARILADSPKANWDPATAPDEFEVEEEELFESFESEPQPEEEIVEPDTPAAEEFKKIGAWTIKVEPVSVESGEGEPSELESDKVELGEEVPGNVEPVELESDKLELDNRDPDEAETEKLEAPKLEPDEAEPEAVHPAKADPD